MPDTIEQEGITWIEIKDAARMSRTKAAIIREEIEAGKTSSLSIDCHTYIPLTAANRLKRESATMAKVRRLNRERKLPPAHNYGVLTKEKQDVLPMSSGRRGRGWIRHKPE